MVRVTVFDPVLELGRPGRRVVQRNGFDDVLFTDAESTISEGATWNIGFVVDDDYLVWPKAGHVGGAGG